MQRDMGNYEVISSVETEECSLRLLKLDRGKYVNLHHHDKTTQTYFVIEGVVEVTIGRNAKKLQPYEILRIPPQAVHGLRSTGPSLVLSISIPPLQMDDQHLL